MLKNSEKFITVGQVGAPCGVQGSMRIISFTEQATDIFEYRPWYLMKKNQWVPVEFENNTRQGKYFIAKLVGCENREQAQPWTNSLIAIKREQLPELPPGQYYWSDLAGLTVKTLDGALLGNIDKIVDTGANPVMVVIQDQRRCLVPYLPHVVHTVDISASLIVVDWNIDF